MARGAGAAALGRHRDVVLAATPQAGDRAREVGRGVGFREATGARHRRRVGGGTDRGVPGGPKRARAAVRHCCEAAGGAGGCREKMSLHEINQSNKMKFMEKLILASSFVTGLNHLWETVWSTAAARGRFDGDVIRLSAPESPQPAAGTASVARDCIETSSQRRSVHTVVERHGRSVPAGRRVIGAAHQLRPEVFWSAWY